MKREENGKKKKCVFLRGRAYHEIQENKYLFQEGTSSVLDKRFEVCLEWYIKNACFYKKIFYLTTFLNIMCPIISIGLNNILFKYSKEMYMQWVVFLLTMTAGISATILSMSRAQDKWTRYRTSAEFLKRKRVEYLVEKKLKENECFDLDLKYMKIIEDFMSNENAQWEKRNLDKIQNDTEDIKKQNSKDGKQVEFKMGFTMKEENVEKLDGL
ncbi:MAG: DUF4231 domain-containing protein [Lachnospiraceae bacterium]|jgi:hypothetical protein|nr:DUF4231 domain-containing protein [Lachnospiraceae bacterium]